MIITVDDQYMDTQTAATTFAMELWYPSSASTARLLLIDGTEVSLTATRLYPTPVLWAARA